MNNHPCMQIAELVQGLTDVHSSAKFAIEKMTTMNGHIFQHLESHLRHLQNTDRTWMKPRTAKEVRETMDAFMAIVDYLEKDNWTGERINTFFMYAVQTNTNIQGRANEMTFFPQFHFDNHKFGKYLFDVRDDDRKFLKKMLRSKKTPLFIRAHSLQVLGVVAKILDGARAEAMVYFRGCVALCDAVSVEERRQALPLSSPDDPSMTIIQVPLKDGNTTTIQTIGDYLLFVREQAEFFLKVAAVLGKFCGGASSLIPGDYCDGCGTTRGKDESSFLVCSRCKITYYCGKGKTSGRYSVIVFRMSTTDGFCISSGIPMKNAKRLIGNSNTRRSVGRKENSKSATKSSARTRLVYIHLD